MARNLGLRSLNSWLNKFSQVACTLGGVVALLMMLMTVADVCGRYLFNSPVTGTFEFVELAMVPIVFLAIAAPEAGQGGHLRMSLLADNVAKMWERPILVFSDSIAATVVFFLAWRSFVYGLDSIGHGDASSDLQIPKGPLQLLIGGGFLLLGLHYVFSALLTSFDPAARSAGQDGLAHPGND